MFGTILGELAAMPYELGRKKDAEDCLKRMSGPGEAAVGAAVGSELTEGRDFSCGTVMSAAVADGLLHFEKRIPALFSQIRSGTAGKSSFEEAFLEEVEKAMRRLGQAHPLAGYPMDLSIWLFREGAPLSDAEDAGPAVRAVPVAWMFQDDLYMMRHMTLLQARLTHKGRETAAAADAAACAVFLALHGCSKGFIRGFMDRQFAFLLPGEEAVREEILQAGGREAPSLCVRAAMTAFLYGESFEDVLKRAISYGGRCGETAAIAGGIAQAYFGIPKDLARSFRAGLPGDILEAGDAFEAMVERRRQVREKDPAARARWEGALTRGSENHPAAVKGNGPLEEAIRLLNEKKDRQSLVAALEALRMRMKGQGRVFVPLLSVRRNEEGAASSPNSVRCRMQTIRTKDGKLWQPAYSSREHLDRARIAMERAVLKEKESAARKESAASDRAPLPAGMVLSYSIEALLKRFLPTGEEVGPPSGGGQEGKPSAVREYFSGEEPVGFFPGGDLGREEEKNSALPAQTAPSEIEGIVINPYSLPFFLPRVTIRALFDADRGLKDKQL